MFFNARKFTQIHFCRLVLLQEANIYHTLMKLKRLLTSILKMTGFFLQRRHTIKIYQTNLLKSERKTVHRKKWSRNYGNRTMETWISRYLLYEFLNYEKWARNIQEPWIFFLFPLLLFVIYDFSQTFFSVVFSLQLIIKIWLLKLFNIDLKRRYSLNMIK